MSDLPHVFEGNASIILTLLTDSEAFEGCGVSLQSVIDAHKIVSTIDAGSMCLIIYSIVIFINFFSFIPAETGDKLKERILDLYPYSTHFGATYTVKTLDALYGTPDGVVV